MGWIQIWSNWCFNKFTDSCNGYFLLLSGCWAKQSTEIQFHRCQCQYSPNHYVQSKRYKLVWWVWIIRNSYSKHIRSSSCDHSATDYYIRKLNQWYKHNFDTITRASTFKHHVSELYATFKHYLWTLMGALMGARSWGRKWDARGK